MAIQRRDPTLICPGPGSMSQKRAHGLNVGGWVGFPSWSWRNVIPVEETLWWISGSGRELSISYSFIHWQMLFRASHILDSVTGPWEQQWNLGPHRAYVLVEMELRLFYMKLYKYICCPIEQKVVCWIPDQGTYRGTGSEGNQLMFLSLSLILSLKSIKILNIYVCVCNLSGKNYSHC